MNAPLGRVADHRADFFVHQRFAPHKQQVTDVIFHRDVDDVLGFLERDAAALPGIEPVHREAAEIAPGIADVGDGKLEIARSAVAENFAEQSKQPFLRPRAGPGDSYAECGRFCRRGVGGQGGDVH